MTTPSASATTTSPSETGTPPMTTAPPTVPTPSLRLATGVTPRAHTGSPRAATARESRMSPSVTPAAIPARRSSAATRSPRTALRDSPAPAMTTTVPSTVTAPATCFIGELSSRPTVTTSAGPTTVAAGESATIHGGSAPCPPAPSAASVLDIHSGNEVTLRIRSRTLFSRCGLLLCLWRVLRPGLVPARPCRHRPVGAHDRRRGPRLRGPALAPDRTSHRGWHACLPVRPLRRGQPAVYGALRAATDLPRLSHPRQR